MVEYVECMNENKKKILHAIQTNTAIEFIDTALKNSFIEYYSIITNTMNTFENIFQ